MSSIPGIETRAPERTETSSGSSGSPSACRRCCSSAASASSTSLGQPVGRLAAGLHVGDAGLGRDREAGGHSVGAEHPGHLGDVGALAAEQLALLARALGELMDPPHRAGVPALIRPRAVTAPSSETARLSFSSDACCRSHRRRDTRPTHRRPAARRRRPRREPVVAAPTADQVIAARPVTVSSPAPAAMTSSPSCRSSVSRTGRCRRPSPLGRRRRHAARRPPPRTPDTRAGGSSGIRLTEDRAMSTGVDGLANRLASARGPDPASDLPPRRRGAERARGRALRRPGDRRGAVAVRGRRRAARLPAAPLLPGPARRRGAPPCCSCRR